MLHLMEAMADIAAKIIIILSVERLGEGGLRVHTLDYGEEETNSRLFYDRFFTFRVWEIVKSCSNKENVSLLFSKLFTVLTVVF